MSVKIHIPGTTTEWRRGVDGKYHEIVGCDPNASGWIATCGMFITGPKAPLENAPEDYCISCKARKPVLSPEAEQYNRELEAWKQKHGIEHINPINPDELKMAAEEKQAKGNAWCIVCDKEMPIPEMKLITRTIDPYRQIDEEDPHGDYIPKENRIRICPKCFEKEYAE